MCREVDRLADAERIHICVRDGEGSQELGIMVKGQRYVYGGFREDVVRESDLM